MDSRLTFSVPHKVLFFLLTVLQLSGAAGEWCSMSRVCCVSERHLRVEENNPVNFVISNITISEPPVRIQNPAATPDVAVVGKTLQLTKSIDFETVPSPVMIVTLECGSARETLDLTIEIVNVNDNLATFPDKVLNLNIGELFPVNKTWRTEKANDPDGGQIYYSLDPNTNGADYFRLKTRNTPEIILNKTIDYEMTKKLQLILYATDIPNDPSRTDNLTINISVQDEDNKPPVFEPCSPFINPNASICLDAAYLGNIIQHKIETGPLQLSPQQVHAVDGDKGINAEIRYTIIGGDPEKAFKIDTNTGVITMVKAVTSSNTIVLIVMAHQENDHYKFSTTTVTLKVLGRSKYPPKFTKEIYNGIIQEHSEPKSIVLGQSTSTRPLEIQAEDNDFPDKINPSIEYKIIPSDRFTINRDGFIFNKIELPIGVRMYELTVTATDVKTGESANTKVKVRVVSSNAPTTVKTTTAHGTGTPKPPIKPPGTGPTTTGTSTPSKAPPGPPGSTTAKPPGSGPTTIKPHVTGSIATNNPGPPGPITPSGNPPDGSGTGATTTPTTVKTTTHGTGTPKPPIKPPGSGPSTIKPHVTGSMATNNPGPPGSITSSGNPPDGSGTGATTSLPVVNPRLMYEAKEMAAVGVPLSILLIICIIAIGILLRKIHQEKMEWEKINDGSATNIKNLSKDLFSPSSDKLQFANEAFGEEATSVSGQKSSGPSWAGLPAIEPAALVAVLTPEHQTDPKSQRSNSAPTTEEDHKNFFGETDTDAEVKSILTKERKSDEGYKSVWFKEDIEPEANEEHVIERRNDEENIHDDSDRSESFLQLKSDDGGSVSL
ncbi:cadherin-related family member 5-like isoform X2 [Mustelus asterias]